MNCEAARLQRSPTLARTRARRAGFSMTEMVTTISIIGILCAIVVPAMTGALDGSKEAIAREKLEMLNQGLNSYAHCYKEYTSPPSNGSATDELAILNLLQYRDPDSDKADFGSPYIRPDYRPVPSSSSADYRIIWTGLRFKLLRPGESGVGLKVPFDGSDFGAPFVYTQKPTPWGS